MRNQNLLKGLFLLWAGLFLFGCSGSENSSGTGPHTVQDFGAQGDSITDDTQAIREAINSGTGQVNFPSGTYRITSTIEIDLDKVGPVALSGKGTAKIIMNGPGPAFKFTGTHEGTANPDSFKENVWQNQRMPTVDGLEIVGNHPKAEGIEASGTMQLTINRLLVRKALHGIHLTERNRNVIISDVHIYENRGVGIFLDDVNLHQINITNSHISYNGGGGIVVRKGEVRNLHIGTCDIEGNMDENGPPTANVFIDVTEGTMREGSITGSTIQHEDAPPGSANIRLRGHGPDERKKTGHFTIANNLFSDVRNNIHLQYARGVVIHGNSFWKGVEHNILVENSDHINIGPNMLDRNPDYNTTSNNTIVIRESNHLTINGIHLNHTMGGHAGLVLNQCRNYNITNSTILNCEGGGISVKNSSNGKISGNFIRDERDGVQNPLAIQVEGGNNQLVINNKTNGPIEAAQGIAEVANNF